MSPKRNLFLISLDTVRADVAYSGRFPLIEKLKQNTTYFTNAYAVAPLTPISHASVFTGLYPKNHGIRHLFREKLNLSCGLMAEAFKSNGYKTFGIVSCPGMNKWYGFDRGFESYDDEIPLLQDGSDPLLTVDVEKRGTALKRANIVVDRALKKINELKEHSFFGFLHFFDAHWPYSSPIKFENSLNDYEEEIHFTLSHLDRVFSFLEENDLKESTDIIIFSDHGEDLNGWYENDKGGKELGHIEEKGHGCLLYNQTMKVVLMIDANGFEKGKANDRLVSLVDLMPTISEIYKLDFPNKYFDGTSLLENSCHDDKHDLRQIEFETFFPEEMVNKELMLYPNKKGIIFSGIKIINNIETSNIEIYDLKRDVCEVNNLMK